MRSWLAAWLCNPFCPAECPQLIVCTKYWVVHRLDWSAMIQRFVGCAVSHLFVCCATTLKDTLRSLQHVVCHRLSVIMLKGPLSLHKLHTGSTSQLCAAAYACALGCHLPRLVSEGGFVILVSLICLLRSEQGSQSGSTLDCNRNPHPLSVNRCFPRLSLVLVLLLSTHPVYSTGR